MNELELHWHKYKYFDYEKELAISEVESLLEPKKILNIKNGVKIFGEFNEDSLERLVYFSKIHSTSGITETIQAKLEQSQLQKESRKRQYTRYSIHGLHEYKGKFNPQIVKVLLNLFKAKEGDRLLDPFCGSGTSLSECSLMSVYAEGTDINPMAIYLSNAKIAALNTKADILGASYENIKKEYKKISLDLDNSSERIEYLLKWFNKEIILEAEIYKESFRGIPKNHKIIFSALISDVLRDYSLQEPRDLRTRKRKSPFPTMPFTEAIDNKICKFLKVLRNSQEITGVLKVKSKAILSDNRKLQRNNTKRKFDFAITSPPYAMALPYIDTQRLSLIWLELCEPKKIKDLEASLTGSRELNTKAKKDAALRNLKLNTSELPIETHLYCINLLESIGDSDGFRRQAVPILLYKYFSDMKRSFESVIKKVKIGGNYALIVGHNKTTLGGTEFKIETPHHLSIIASQCGWLKENMIPLQTYKRYDIHSANAINSETLIILKAND